MVKLYANMTVDIKGLTRLLANIDDGVNGGLSIASAREVSAEVVKEAKRLSRVRTGKMKKGWTRRRTRGGYIVYDPVRYTVYNEFGTRKMSAKPMLGPAMRKGAKFLAPAMKKYFEFGVRHLITETGEDLTEDKL